MTQFADPNQDFFAQRIILASGTPTEPVITWANDLTKGFYFDTDTNEIKATGFSGGGGVTYPLLAPSGSAGAPSYSFTDEPTKGMYLDGSNLRLKDSSGDLALVSGATGLFEMAGDTIYFSKLFRTNESGSVNEPTYSYANATSTGMYNFGTTTRICGGGTDLVIIAENGTPGQTSLYIFDVDSGLVQPVKVGPNNSGPGGSGRALYIENV